MKYKLKLSLPPSENQRFTRNKYTGFLILSKKAREWLEVSSQEVWWFVRSKRIKPVSEFVYVDVDFYLSRKNQDSHNHFKLLADSLEKGGLVINDKYLMFRTQRVNYDSRNPRVELTFTL